MTVTVLQDVVDWAIQHKRGNAFKDFTDEQIGITILRAYHEGNMLIDVNNKNEIFGIVLYTPTVVVDQILTTHKYSLKNLILTLKQKFLKHTALARRHGKLKYYNVEHLIRKIYG